MASKSLKQAPRREILEVTRVGDWGEVSYEHRLSCGHVEIRKRKSPKTHIGCLGCVKAADFEAAVTSVTVVPVESVSRSDNPDWNLVEEIASVESQVERLRAAIAAHNGISGDSVDVVISQATTRPEVSYVLAFIDANAAMRILKKSHDS